MSNGNEFASKSPNRIYVTGDCDGLPDLRAPRAASLRVNERAAIREHTRAPLILLASNGSPALLEAALEHDVADVLLLPQLTHNVVFPIRTAGHPRQRVPAAPR